MMVVAGLSLSYSKQLLSSQRWRGRLQKASEAQKVWRRFEETTVRSVFFASARKSHCVGFCPLSTSLLGRRLVWRNGTSLITYHFDYYVNQQEIYFYRLCARQAHNSYHCWWWRKHQLISHGKVVATD